MKAIFLILIGSAIFLSGCASDDTKIETTETFSRSQVINDPRVITDESFDKVC